MKFSNKNIFYLALSNIYGCVTKLRNLLFDNGLLKSVSFDIPIISIGNLAVGGTGKTPHTEYIISLLQEKNCKMAVLSRGYKRKTAGFVLADKNASSQTIGDEPFQILKKFPNIIVAVDEKRVRGVKKLLTLFADLQVIILDDAFQHRYIKAGLSILLTDYHNLYCEDRVMPAGSLREYASGSSRADTIIVTKCPSKQETPFGLIESKLGNPPQEIYFSSYQYVDFQSIFPEHSLTCLPPVKGKVKVGAFFLFTGIASPQLLIEHLKSFTENIHLFSFPDHHFFTQKDYISLENQFFSTENTEKFIIVTEKDAARILGDKNFPNSLKPFIFSAPIKVEILKEEKKLIKLIERLEI